MRPLSVEGADAAEAVVVEDDDISFSPIVTEVAISELSIR